MTARTRPLEQPKRIMSLKHPKEKRKSSKKPPSYQKLIEGIGGLSAKHLPQAREQVRALVGDLWLTPTKASYLEATLTGRYEGLVKLLGGGMLNRDGCGGRI